MSSSNKSPLHERKIPSKLLTRETSGSISNPSFRVYYGKAAAGSVPFLWESQPGTPKHPSTTSTPHTQVDQHSFPPLTPPPSYFYYTGSESIKKKSKSPNLLHIILPKLTLKRPNLIYRSSSSSSCSSSEPSSPAVGNKTKERRASTARLSSPKTNFFSTKEEGLHALMPCFGARR